MTPVRQLDSPDLRQPQIQFVHQPRSLQRVAGLFAPEISRRDRVKIVVGERGQASQGLAVACLPAMKQPRDLAGNRSLGGHGSTLGRPYYITRTSVSFTRGQEKMRRFRRPPRYVL